MYLHEVLAQKLYASKRFIAAKHFAYIGKICLVLKKPSCILMVILVENSQTEFMVEIDSKSLVRATGKVLLIKLSQNTI